MRKHDQVVVCSSYEQETHNTLHGNGIRKKAGSLYKHFCIFESGSRESSGCMPSECQESVVNPNSQNR